MFSLQFLDEAKDDIRSINKYISQKSGYKSAGRNFVIKLINKCEKLAESPFLLGVERPELRPNLRSFPYGSYVIFFQNIKEGNILQIVRIIRASRDIKKQFDD